MKNIYKIKFHPLFYIVVVISILTGHFNEFSLFLLIIIIHEFGHIISGILFKWRIKQINILPFGAITIFDEGLTKPLFEEFIIAIMGPIFQIIVYNVLKSNYDVKSIHYSLLFFNLLPIVPLDGAKIMNILLNVFFPFKKSLLLTIVISVIWLSVLTFLLLINKLNLLFLLILFFLLARVYKELKSHQFIVHKFLYERFYLPKKYRHTKMLNGVDVTKMYKDHNHIFKVNNICYTEHEILRKMFDFKGKL